MNKLINVTLAGSAPISYPVIINVGLLSELNAWLPACLGKVIIISDDTVKEYYAEQLITNLKKAGIEPILLSFPAGEKSKTARTKQLLENAMLDQHCGRDSLILTLGGGVVGDMAGFVAATYMRGIPYIQIPTTLLAMLDSSVGGKTGINTSQGKNLIGAFWQPSAVVIDMQCITTLPTKHVINGLVEALKMFLTSDADAFHFFYKNKHGLVNKDTTLLTELVRRAIEIKTSVVQEDEKERHVRQILNFGHTIGHAIEKESHYRIPHGMAVGYGILWEAKIAALMGKLAANDYVIIKNTLADVNIKAAALKKISVERIIQHTKSDKKVKNDHVQYVLLSGLGRVYKDGDKVTHAVPDSVVMNAFAEMIGA